MIANKRSQSRALHDPPANVLNPWRRHIVREQGADGYPLTRVLSSAALG